MRIVFAGTPEFARSALEALHAAGHEIVLVLTQPDRPAGRGMQLAASPVKQYALELGIAVAQPTSLKLSGKYPGIARQAHELLHGTPHDVMVVAAYGLILPQSVLDIAPHGCLNIHASLLPRWRGAAPIHRAIEAGDAQTGITIMQMDAGLDTGPMLLTERMAIAPRDTTATLHDRLAALGGRLIVQALRHLQRGELVPVPQPADGVTYAAKIEKDEAMLDFGQPASVLERRIRAFDPFPGASTRYHQSNLKVWDATVSTDHGGRAPGTILGADQAGVRIACADSSLIATTLQKPGGKRLPVAEFLQGFPLKIGDTFSA